MKTKAVCCWCLSLLTVKGNFNIKKDKAVCSRGCRDAEHLFCAYYSDTEINKRTHYRELTQGGSDG